MNDSQYGFRNHRSTAMAIIDLIEYVTTALDKKKHVMGIFIDLKKAFDKIDHEILMKKLYHYGLRGISQKWIQSYLSQRKQFVEYDEVKSSCKDIVCGIPQGSILGPKLFILYINDICNVSTLLKYVLFADDTNLLYEHENYETLCMNVNNELSKLNEWFSINKLSLNVKKTNFMVFGNKHINETLKIRINNEDIVKVSETKFLGIYIDFRLNWKKHIQNISNKVSKCIAIIYRASRVLNETALIMLYNTQVLPYFTYCSEVWGRTYRNNLYTLNIKQK